MILKHLNQHNHSWNVLDFSDIEKSLAAKLSDSDIDNILRSVDAINSLQILKLAGCVNITGSGLDVLRSSVAIQQVDMSLVGKHEVPLVEPEPLLSESVVIPILDEIISRGRGSSLKQLEFPKKWRTARSIQMTQFLGRYEDYMRNQRYCCSKCDRLCVETGRNEWISLQRDELHGTQSYTCSGCLKHFCYRLDCCRDENGKDNSNWCEKCEKEYCKSCAAMIRCSRCRSYACNECDEMKTCEGEGCETVLCDDCSEKNTCCYCGKMRCQTCAGLVGCSLSHCKKGVCLECYTRRESEVGWDEAGKCECGESLVDDYL